MISPYVRRLRLAQELRDRRQAAGITSQELAKRAGVHRQMVSRLENAHVPPDQDDVLALLDALGVEGREWTELVTIANEAASRGWWEGSAKQMGERQALFANLEAGADTIRDYAQALIPGLLQTPEYTRARIELSDDRPMAAGATLDGVLRGRANRQRLVRRSGSGPEYESVIDEIAIRRLGVPSDVLSDQLISIAKACEEDERIRVRVLPVDARFDNYAVPVCAFGIYTYANGDPGVVAIEAVTAENVLTEKSDLGAYERIFEGLWKGALSADASHDYLIKTAEGLRPC
ncbi:helix-turn-helix transcriptional regulator [Spirillospora sp. NPDC052269]